MKPAIIFLLLVVVLAPSACQWNGNAAPLGRDFGDTTSHNISQHVIDPEPVHIGSGAPAMDGERAKSAVDRYRSGRVLAPQAESTGGGGL